MRRPVVSGVSELVDLARSVAIDVGQMVYTKRQGVVTVADTKSTDSDVVTEVDRAAERLILDKLMAARPLDGFLGEEGGLQASQSGITWVVDPIDGTVNFLYGIPEYTVSIAAVEGPPTPEEWTILAGAIVNPSTGDVFTAGQGQGAFHGDTAMAVRPPVELSQALLLTGFAYGAHYRKFQAEVLVEILPKLRDIRRIGTASLDLAMIAGGHADIYAERTIRPWDFAAGAIMVEEAGGVVTGFHGQPPGREAVLAGHPEMVAKLHDLLVSVGGDIPLSDIAPLS
jgi:myo-inositol-1(or 4)-monophosphatase